MLYGEADRTADSGKCDLLWNGTMDGDGLIMVRGYREGSIFSLKSVTTDLVCRRSGNRLLTEGRDSAAAEAVSDFECT